MNPFAKFTIADVEEFNRKTAAGKLKKQSVATTATITAAASEELLKKKTARMERRPRKSEADIQQEIESFLMLHTHECWWDRKRMDRPTTSRVGVVDFVGAWRGIPFGLEVKAEGGKPSPEQLAEMAWMKKAGAVVGVVFSKGDAVEFFLCLEARKKEVDFFKLH